MSFYQKGPVRIGYEEHGSGFPLLLIAGGGLNSTISGLISRSPFNPSEEFKGEYRSIASDLRNAVEGQSTGPLEIDRPWDSFADDHLGLMDHLGIQKFMVLGFCIGGPLIWNLLRRAPDRVAAAVLAQPSGSRPEMRDLFYENNMQGWGPAFVKRRPEIKMETIDRFLTKMYRNNPDFVFTVTRDFVRDCQTPVPVLPDDIPAHPYAVAMEAAMLAPKAEVSMFPWKEPKERIPLAVRQIPFLPNVLFCGEPLNNGQPKSRHRRHSPASLPRDRFPVKSIETETRQLRENPLCVAKTESGERLADGTNFARRSCGSQFSKSRGRHLENQVDGFRFQAESVLTDTPATQRAKRATGLDLKSQAACCQP